MLSDDDGVVSVDDAVVSVNVGVVRVGLFRKRCRHPNARQRRLPLVDPTKKPVRALCAFHELRTTQNRVRECACA